MLNERAKSLLAKLSKQRLDSYAEVRDYLLREFKLSAETYRDKFWTATKQTDETYTLFGSRVRNLLLYYLDSRKVVSKDDIVDLFVADRIKQTLSDTCLRHVLSTEGSEWLRPERLTDVIDTYVNSHLSVNKSVVGGLKPSRTFQGVAPATLGNGHGIKSPTVSNDRGVLRCWLCNRVGHVASSCRERKARLEANSQAEKRAGNDKTGTRSQNAARVSHISVTTVADSPKFDYLPHYRVNEDSIPKLRFTPKNGEMSSSVSDGDNVRNDVVFDNNNMDVEGTDEFPCPEAVTLVGPQPEQLAAPPAIVARSEVNVYTEVGVADSSSTLAGTSCPSTELMSTMPVHGSVKEEVEPVVRPVVESVAEVSNVVQLSELDYCDIQIQQLNESKKALKDTGAQISLIREDLIRNLDLPVLGTVSIRGVVGKPVEAKLIQLNLKPWPGNNAENIAPYISVTFAACDLSTDIDVILSGSVVNQLDDLCVYNMLKPTVSFEVMSSVNENTVCCDVTLTTDVELSDCDGEIAEVNIVSNDDNSTHNLVL